MYSVVKYNKRVICVFSHNTWYDHWFHLSEKIQLSEQIFNWTGTKLFGGPTVVVFHVYAQDYTRKNCMRRGLCYHIGLAVFIGLLTIFYIGYRNIS